MSTPPVVPPGVPPATAMPGPITKADLAKRFLAALIDGVLAALVSWIPVIGGIIAAAYMVVRDGLELEFADRRSIGKRVMKLRPVRLDGQPMDVGTSVKRNLPFVIGWLGLPFMVIPLLGWVIAILLAVVGLVVAIIEGVMVITDPDGRRMGDKLAATVVVETTD